MNPSDRAGSLREAVARRPALDAIRAFVSRWHGIDLDVPRWNARADVPASLALALPHERRLCRQNHLVLPDPDPTDPIRFVFYVENQGSASWAYRASGAADPPVSWLDVTTNVWHDETMALDEFLLTALMMEATIGGSYKNGAYTRAAPASTLEAALAPLAPVGRRWQWLSTQCYAGDEVIAFTVADKDGAPWLKMAATHSAALHYLNPIIQSDPMPWLEIRVDGQERYPIDGF